MSRIKRPVATYSIVAIDRERGEMGVAVQSHWFSVGSVVPWAKAGVGVVATQSLVDISYGPLGLAMLEAGKTPEQALRGLLSSDPHPEFRQVAILDVEGRVAVHTGEKCIPEAGHIVGEGYSVQANLMRTDKVWEAMASAFEDSRGGLADRLVVALEAAEEAGGDIRGRQSAALLVVKCSYSGKPWEDTAVELRVEDHPEPVKELKRLLRLHKAYVHSGKGDDFLSEGKVEEAMREYSIASRLAPEIDELPFWQAVTMIQVGRVDDAIPILSKLFRKNPSWRELIFRLPRVGLIPDKPEILEILEKI